MMGPKNKTHTHTVAHTQKNRGNKLNRKYTTQQIAFKHFHPLNEKCLSLVNFYNYNNYIIYQI